MAQEEIPMNGWGDWIKEVSKEINCIETNGGVPKSRDGPFCYRNWNDRDHCLYGFPQVAEENTPQTVDGPRMD